MTRDKLVEIICDEDEKKQFEDRDYGDLADRILAALDQERVGEVVIGSGVLVHDKYDGSIEFEREDTCGNKIWVQVDCESIDGKRGTLIFREQEGK